MKRFLSKSLLLLGLISLLGFAGCEREDFYNTKDEDREEMESLRKEIDKLSTQVKCENNYDWKFTTIGAKTCGGPVGYIAYSTKIDEALFLKKVALYTQKQKAFNIKWVAGSDCSIPSEPKSVECDNDKPKFVY